jgi:two-component system NtrC family sensor kinase
MQFAKSIASAVGSSLKLKLILFIILLLGLTIGIAPWSAIRMQRWQLLRASNEHLRTLHEMLRDAIVDTCMLTGNPAAVQQLLESVSHHQEVEAVRLFNTDGVIRYSSRAAERGGQLSPAELSRFVGHPDPVLIPSGGGGMVHTLVRPMFNQPSCTHCHPSDQKIIGILQVSLSLSSVWQELATLRRSAIVATVIALGVIVIGVWLSLTLFIDQPLQRLIAVMARAEGGDLGARVESGSSDELGRLARNFNAMISKLDAAQQEIERYHQEQLARADRLATIGEMAAAIAHEIRNPLTGISGALSVLSRNFPADDPRRDIVRETHLLIERLNKSVEEILHYSRPSQPQLQIVDLGDIIDRTLSLVEGEARKARVPIVKDFQPAGGAGAVPMVNADPHQLQQVLMNLVLNAIQASTAGGEIHIRTHAIENPAGQPCACIEIEDSGKGMSADEVAKAFQPFFSTKAQGTGLGLAIAKQIVEQHHGRITLRSIQGKSTCVQVELPAHQPTASATA